MSVVIIVLVGLIIAAGFLFTLVPIIIGAVKKRRVVKPVEYFPPRGASPLDILINYYGANANPREIFNPLMLYWAERGFITIEEDCKRGLKLTKIKDFESPESQDGFDAATFEIEEQLFAVLFSGSKKVFYTLSALSGFESAYQKVTSECKSEAKSVTNKKSRGIKLASLLISFATLALVIIILGVATRENFMVICIFPFVAMAFPKGVLYSMGDGKDGLPKGSVTRFLFIPFFSMFGAVPLAAGVSVFPVPVAVLIVCAYAVCAVNVFILNDRIDIRTESQLKYYARICGFKKFLLLAEVEQIEKLVEEDPRYYFNVLPYCYVLKITGKLKPKFDRIALDGPAWYLGELRETLMF